MDLSTIWVCPHCSAVHSDFNSYRPHDPFDRQSLQAAPVRPAGINVLEGESTKPATNGLTTSAPAESISGQVTAQSGISMPVWLL